MRAWLLCIVASVGGVACTPDIAPGTYFCGPEQFCPEGLECNGTDNICTIHENVEPFGCDVPDRTDDDAPAQGLTLVDVGCVSGIRELQGCVFDEDPGDWFQFDVPDNCNGVVLQARLTFPVAYEPMKLQLSTENGAPADAETPCDNNLQFAGQDQRCFRQTVSNGAHLAVGILHSGVDDCDGNCKHNRYTLDVQLLAP